MDEAFHMDIVHVQNPHGKGHRRKPFVDFTKLLQDKSSILQIRNQDELCCARALVTAIARHEKHPQWNSIRQGCAIQRQMAEQLHQRAGVPLLKCGLEEVKKFQTVLSDYQIYVLSKEHFNGIIYDGVEGGVPIYLYYHDEHYDVITKMTGFLNRSYFCDTCKKGYSNKENHVCNNPCVYCHKLHSEEDENWKFCDKCNDGLRMNIVSKCICRKVVIWVKVHVNRTSSAEIVIKQSISPDTRRHTFVMNTIVKPVKTFLVKIISVICNQSMSTTLTPKARKVVYNTYFSILNVHKMKYFNANEDILREKNGKCVHCKKSWCCTNQHRPNLCVVHKVCHSCINNPVTSASVCKACGKNEHTFHGPETTDEFCKWLFSENNAGATVICHNFKGYDSYPILHYLHDHAVLPKVITTGSKYMSINVPVCNIRMIDSLNFIPMPLADMPESFGEVELTKGYFPHLFNRKENQRVILPSLLDLKYYTPDSMKPGARAKFLKWYEENKNTPFDFQIELLRYCKSDVDILRRCCLKFRKLFMDLTRKGDTKGIDPFEKCVTIASACNLVYRTNFLEHESIAITLPHGYCPEEKQSKTAYGWLAYYAHSRGVHIQHGRNGGENILGPTK